MAKSLGGVILPDAIEWLGRYDWTGVAQNRARTLSGALVVWAQSLQRGQPINLVAREEVSWLELATVTALQALAATPGGSHVLVWESESHQVAFAEPAVRFEPIWPHYPQHFASIQLLTL